MNCHYVASLASGHAEIQPSASLSENAPTQNWATKHLLTPPVDFETSSGQSSAASHGSATHPTIDSHPSSRHAMTFVFRVFRTYPQMLAHGGVPPFIHHSQIQGGVHPTLRQCIDILSGLNAAPASTVESMATNGIIRLLAEVFSRSFLSSISSQALTIV